MKVLRFWFRNEIYYVNELGHIKSNNLKYFSDKWIFVGGAKHHWCNTPNVYLKDVFKNPKLLDGCLSFDIDHGTRRRWGGVSMCGKLSRISEACVVDNYIE